MITKTREPKLDLHDDVTTLYSAAAIDGDPSRYLSFPQLGAPALITFVEKLLQAAPDEPHALIAEAAERLAKDAQVLKAALTQNVHAQTGLVRAPLDRLVRLMAASFERARALAELPESGVDIDAARFVIAQIFPSRLDFTQRTSWDILGDVEIRLSILEQANTREAFDRVVGSVVRARIEEAVADLKSAIGTAPPRNAKKAGKFTFVAQPVADIAGAMAEVRLSVLTYAQRVVALHDPRDAESQAKMAVVLASIEEIKREWKPARGRGGAGGGEEMLVSEAAVSAPVSVGATDVSSGNGNGTSGVHVEIAAPASDVVAPRPNGA